MSGYYSIRDQQIRVTDDFDGDRILVLCTGGDDVFTKLLKQRAVLIVPDEELMKGADTKSLRIVMNPLKLSFAPESFDLVICFFTFFYLPKHKAVFENVNHVLKRWGRLLVWDAVIPKKIGHKSFYAVPLLIDSGFEVIKTVHVTKWKFEQNSGLIKKIARENGFKLLKEETYDQIFYLEFSKVADAKK
ncbi:MAG TPA: methyltransferase domain-containing protein [Pseudothermotoga sp.]|nr:methyltransferase domain-containing protein [Pseudothermotoga sp.]HOK83445.1 methyltransferase domain-containing protein [Pseudothermotoga sp.]HPP69518.1 methyltransferase domain-containing protein [Pseudothermotoga sp.]